MFTIYVTLPVVSVTREKAGNANVCLSTSVTHNRDKWRRKYNIINKL